MELLEQLEQYRPFNEQEARDREELLRRMCSGEDLYTRDNSAAHFTASAWVVSPGRDQVLMAYHNLYDSWAWLGGHADGERDLLSVALREVREESGLVQLRPVFRDIYSLEILTVNGHEKHGRYVSSHLHLNLTYLLEADPCFDVDYTAKPIDLRIMRVAESNWAEAVKTASGHLYKMQISIQHSGDFGFTALLKLNLSDGKPANPGTYYANLYQLSGDQLKWSVYSDLAEESGKYIAKLEFTHASDWLVTIDSEINPGSGNDGGSTGGFGNRVNGIKKARTLKSEGWDNIVKEIKSTGEGSVIEITLNDETTMPEDALQAAIDRKMKLIMDAGFGRIWEIDGAKAVPGKYIDLSISGVDVGIPEASYAGILCSDSRQLRINARLLNFTAQLTAFIGKDNIGQNAALYSYNDETGKLVFQDISAVDRDGNVIFNIKCGGRYFIALGSEVAPPAYLCGDVNGDGVVNAHDAAAILKYATYGYPLDKRCGDTNADGAVDAHDALPILNYVVGNVKLLPAVGFRQ